MGQLTQTTTELQAIVDNSDAANVGKTSLTDGSDTTAVAFKKSGFYSLQGSSSNAPSTDRAVLISAIRDTAATGEIRYGQIAITESNGLWWNRDDGGSLGTWYAAVSTTGTQTLTNKTLTSPVLTTPQINDSAADHQYIFAGSNLVADRTVTLPLLASDDTFVFAAHTQTLTNKTLTTPTVSGLTLSDASIIFEGATADAHETTLTVSDPTADRTITLPDATDTLVGLATTDTLTNKTLTSPVLNTGVSGTAVLNADDFTGASATTLATSESIKAYVDAQVGTVDTLAEVLANGNATDGTNVVVTAGDVITTDTISETTAAAGVTIDGVLLKDDGVNATNLEVTNIKANDGTAAGSIADSTGVVTLASSVLTTTDINGGTIDSAVIGGTTPAAITGTAITATGIMTATGTSVFASLDISGDIDVDGTANLDVVDIDGAVDFGSTTAHAGNATFADNAKAIFGAGSDLQIYHDGGASRIVDAGTGILAIQASSQLGIYNADGTQVSAEFVNDGKVGLRFSGSEKLATTATGIDVTGGITSSGNLEITSAIPKVILTDSNNPNGQMEMRGANTEFVFDFDPGNAENNSQMDFKTDGSRRLLVKSTGIDVTGTATMDGLDVSTGVYNINTSGTSLISSTGSVKIDIDSDNNATDNRFLITSDGNTKNRLQVGESGDISFYEDTGTTPKFFWDASAESLGIGTSSPSNKLHLNADGGGSALARLTNTNSSGYGLLIDSTDTNNARYGLKVNGGGGTAFYVGNGGNVGIGTSSPSSVLELSKATYPLLTITQSTTGQSWQLGNDGSNLYVYNATGSSRVLDIDSSGNLLVGKTSQATATIGAELGSSGYVSGSRDGNTAGFFNRATSDGEVIRITKDGTTVGSIGAFSSGVAGISLVNPTYGGIRTADYRINPVNGSGANFDNSIDLGAGGTRFKNLYLSGGVYLGGTGAANLLDDYEEGDHTTSITCTTSGTVTVNTTFDSVSYIKIGQLVTVTGLVIVGSVSSPVGAFKISMPFAVTGSGVAKRGSDSAAAITVHNSVSANSSDYVSTIGVNSSDLTIYLGDNPDVQDDSAQQLQTGTEIYFHITYRTA